MGDIDMMLKELKRYGNAGRDCALSAEDALTIAAALEAAREDGLRLDWLADNMHMIAKCGGLWFSSDGAGPYQDRTLRGAIDQARAADGGA